MKIGDIFYGLAFLAFAAFAGFQFYSTREGAWLFGAIGWLGLFGAHCQLVSYRGVVDAAVAMVKGGAV